MVVDTEQAYASLQPAVNDRIMKIKIVLLLLLVFAFNGCKQNKQKVLPDFTNVIPEKVESNVTDMEILEGEVPSIPVDPSNVSKMILLSSVVDSVSFLQLESCDKALIGGITKIIYKDNSIYISDRLKTKSIKKFSADGKYIGDIGKYGEAPGEYTEPTDFIIRDTLITVYDQFGCRLNYYNLGGKYLYSKKVPFLFLRFYQFPNNEFIFHSLDADNQHLSSIVDYSIFETYSMFVINKRGFHRKKDYYSSIVSEFNFSEMNGRLYFHPPFSDDIYEIQADGNAKLRFKFDFGKKKLPEKYLLSENWDSFLKESDNSTYNFFPGEFLYTQNSLYFAYINQHDVHRCFYSLKRKSLVCSSLVKNDLYPIFPFANLIGVDHQSLISYVSPSQIVRAREEYDRKEWTKMVGEKSADLSMILQEEDNPIIVKYHLKD